MQCACAILSSVASPALHNFYTTSDKRTILGGKKLLDIKCVFMEAIPLC